MKLEYDKVEFKFWLANKVNEYKFIRENNFAEGRITEEEYKEREFAYPCDVFYYLSKEEALDFFAEYLFEKMEERMKQMEKKIKRLHKAYSQGSKTNEQKKSD